MPTLRPLLRPGSRVGIIAPSGVFDPERLERGMALIASWGLVPVPAPALGRRFRYLAGSIEERRADLRWGLSAPDLDAVWMARGGFGMVHLLDGLDALSLDRRPIIGFSDATALFCALDRRRAGLRVHGPVLQSLADLADADSQEALRALLMEGRRAHLPGTLVAGPAGPVRGRLVGGNLCMLASLAGTPWALDARRAVVLLEDVGEVPYKIDRTLMQLLHSGGFAGARAVVLGSFTGCPVPEGADWTLLQVLVERLSPLGVPILAELPVGHGSRNRAWVHGGQVRLDSQGLRPMGAL